MNRVAPVSLYRKTICSIKLLTYVAKGYTDVMKPHLQMLKL